MSLKVWLPLDGDLRNLGTSNIEVTNNGATVNNAGKIGKCYYFDGNAHYLQLSQSVGNLYSGDFSWAVWLKPTDSTRSIISSEYASTGASNVAFELSASRGVRIYWNGSPDIYPSNSTLPIDTWTHVAITKTTGIIKTYLNGVLTNTYTGTLSDRPSTSYIRIGDDYRGGTSVSYMGYMNDWRLYDHCLSAAEVHEIAQGLVLHYKLDSIEIKNGTNLVTGITTGGQTTLLTDGRLGVQTSGQNADTYFKLNLSENIIKDTTYFLSCDASGISEGQYWYFPLGTQSNTTLSFKIYNGHNEMIFTANDISWTQNGDLKLMLDDIRAFYGPTQFYNFQLIKLSANNTQLEIQDSSGYNHNGTLWAYDTTGRITASSDTARYNISTFIDSDNNTTNTASGTHYIYGNCILYQPATLTCAFWCKPIAGYGNGTGQGQFSLTNNDIGNNAGSDYQGGPMNHRDSIIDINDAAGNTHKTVSINFIANEWHHYAIVYDGRYAKTYKDGVLFATADMGSNMALGSMKGAVIGFSKAGGVWRSNKSYYSDFRIYCTPLLDTDIKMLYNVGMKVDNLGEIHAFELNEKQSNLFRSELIQPFAKSGQTVGIGEIVTHNDTYAMNIRPAPFYQNLENNVSGTLKGYFAPNTSYIFDMWIDVDSVISNGNNVTGGFNIKYTDGTSDTTFNLIGGNQGYQHRRLITPNNKTIDRLEIYYYTSLDVFYRLDSYICPISQTKLYKNGTIESSSFTENINKVQIIKGSSIHDFTTIEI